MPWGDPKILDEILAQSQEFRSPTRARKFRRFATSIGLVESGGRNLRHGDADSVNFRQERAQGYADDWARTGGPYNTKAIVDRLAREFRQMADPGESAATIAAQVQRPAAQYAGRYAEAMPEARRLLRQAGAGGRGRGQPGGGAEALLGASGGRAALPEGSDGLTALLASLSGQQRPQIQSAGVQAPEFAAGPQLAGQVPVSGGGPAPKPKEIQGLLEAIRTTGVSLPGGGQGVTPSGRQGSLVPTRIPSDQQGAGAAVQWAQSKVGFREQGTNAGGIASRLNKQFGFSNAPWCAMFTSAAVTRGGAPESARTARVADVRAKAQQRDGYEGFVNPRRAQAGDLILWGDDHIGLVTGRSKGQIQFIAGNHSDGVRQDSVPIGNGDIVRPKYGERKR